MVQYDDARDEAHRVMREVARVGGTIRYGELVTRIRALHLEANDPRLAKILDDVSRLEHREDRGMLSAVVVRVDDSLPGDGFFKLAASLGYDVSDRVVFYAAELERVHTAFARPARRN
jgi:hypothetical protein